MMAESKAKKPAAKPAAKDAAVNMRGLKCPLPTLKTRKLLSKMTVGELLVIECTDPLTTIDIPNLVRETGDTIEASGKRGRVLTPNSDAGAGLQLRLAGARLRRIDVALLTALGLERVLVRQPRVHVVRAGAGEIVRGAATLIASAVNSESGMAVTGDLTLEAALNDDSADMVVAIGGTGNGRSDASVRTLARVGTLAFHGIGITPGETTAIGFIGARPVLLLPGRIDSALAGWLTIGRRMLARRAFRLIEDQPFAAELARKIASPLGLAEVVAVRRRLGKVEPVAQGYLSMQALAHAEGWILIPADSEGHAPGARVVVRPWP